MLQQVLLSKVQDYLQATAGVDKTAQTAQIKESVKSEGHRTHYTTHRRFPWCPTWKYIDVYVLMWIVGLPRSVHSLPVCALTYP
jgi:hypothetical protein